jgi:hypothetical protein
MKIYLDFNNKLNSSVFETNSFSNLKRPLNLMFESDHNMTYFDERIFSPFFAANIKNKIEFMGHSNFDCYDCRSYWMFKDLHYLNRTDIRICSNGNKILDVNNFDKCH